MESLVHPDATIRIEETGESQRLVTIVPERPDYYVHVRSWRTSYPVPLMERILAVKGPAYLLDEIRREEDPAYVLAFLREGILGYLSPEEFSGKRILDFGCGCGSSSLVMSRLFPSAVILGVELEKQFLDVARERASFRAAENVRFLPSPAPDRLPEEIGQVDFITLNAVYEHLLPGERRLLMPMLWSLLAPGGVLFLNQTPNRYFPIESHTTGLPLVNYLPASLAYPIVRKAWRQYLPGDTWEDLLRKGIRGAAVGEIMGHLRRGVEPRPVLMKPHGSGLNSHLDLWFRISEGSRPMFSKHIMKRILGVLNFVTRCELSPHLFLAIRKSRGRNMNCA